MPAVSILDSRHHTLLQAVMIRGPLSEKSAITMYKSLFNSTEEGFGEFLLAINKELEFFRLELKKITNQYDGKGFYGIINTLPSKEAKLGTQFSPAQILFFRALVEAIVQEPTATGIISSTDALNLKVSESQPPDAVSQPSPKLSLQAKQDAIDLLAAEQFLSHTKDGAVALGVRAFLELRSVFRNLEVPFCDICNEAAIKALLCTTEDCLKRVHSYCVTRGSSISRNQRPKCSGCETAWKNPLDEGNVPTEDEYVEPIATQDPTTPAPVQTSRKARTSRKRTAPVEDDEEGEHEATTSRKRRAPVEDEAEEHETRTSRKRRAAVEDDEEEEHEARTSRKRRAPVEDEAEEHETRTSRKRRAAVEDDEEEEHEARTSRKRRAPVEDEAEEHETRTSRKRRAAVEDDEEEEHEARTSRKRRAPVEDDEEEEHEARTSRKRRAAVEDDDEEEQGANVHESDEEQQSIKTYRTRSARTSGR